MRFFLLLFWFFLISSIGFSQTDWQALQMGSSAKKWQGKLTDVSNPNSLDETAFVLNEEIDFYGIKAKKVELASTTIGFLLSVLYLLLINGTS